jgi:cytochrome c biogenesis protein CcmG, thiol:disulfide interchange protein DsbE
MMMTRLIYTLCFIASTLFSQLASAVEVGQAAPSFEVPAWKGDATSLKQYQGKVVLLDFWASWCGPCRQSFPLFNQLYKDLREKDFVILAVNIDEDQKDALKFLEEVPVDFTIGFDPKGKIPEIYGLTGMPTSYVIGKDGKIAKVIEGFTPTELVEIKKEVIKQLNTP